MEKYNEQLKDFLSSLDRRSATRARKLIATACSSGPKKVYNWTNAGTKITPLEREAIDKAINNSFQRNIFV